MKTVFLRWLPVFFLLNAASVFAEDAERYMGESESVDFVIEANDGVARLYIAKKPTNEPLLNAKIKVQDAEGNEKLEFLPGKTPGSYESKMSSKISLPSDLLIDQEDVTDAVEIKVSPILGKKAVVVLPNSFTSKAIFFLLGLFLGVSGTLLVIFRDKAKFLLRKRNKTTSAIVAIIGTFAFAAGPRQVFAHAGHDHGGGEAEPAEIIQGTAVVVAKKSQFLLGIRTIATKKESNAEALSAVGHIIAKPQLDVTLVAPQAGLVKLRPDIILGKAITRGTTLGYIETLGQIPISSPISGQLIEVEATSGTRVEAGSKLFRVTDSSTVWVDAELFQKDLGKIAGVTSSTVSIDGIPEAVEGKILNILTPISEESRTAKFYLELDNKDGKLKIGSLAEISFALDKTKESIAVPTSTVINRGGEFLVFVQTGPETFEPRQVVTKPSSLPGMVLIEGGVTDGERVVVSGNYQLMLMVK